MVGDAEGHPDGAAGGLEFAGPGACVGEGLVGRLVGACGGDFAEEQVAGSQVVGGEAGAVETLGDGLGRVLEERA